MYFSNPEDKVVFVERLSSAIITLKKTATLLSKPSFARAFESKHWHFDSTQDVREKLLREYKQQLKFRVEREDRSDVLEEHLLACSRVVFKLIAQLTGIYDSILPKIPSKKSAIQVTKFPLKSYCDIASHHELIKMAQFLNQLTRANFRLEAHDAQEIVMQTWLHSKAFLTLKSGTRIEGLNLLIQSKLNVPGYMSSGYPKDLLVHDVVDVESGVKTLWLKRDYCSTHSIKPIHSIDSYDVFDIAA
jgi:hypothetical protein